MLENGLEAWKDAGFPTLPVDPEALPSRTERIPEGADESSANSANTHTHTFLPGLVENYANRHELPIKRELTVLFVDIADSTPAILGVSPEEALRFVQRFMGIVTEAALTYCGDVKDYEGDGALLYFESVTEATVAKWFKSIGDAVIRDEPLVELETDKVTLEVNAAEAGTLTEIAAAEGAEVEVGGLLGIINAGGTAITAKAPPPADLVGHGVQAQRDSRERDAREQPRVPGARVGTAIAVREHRPPGHRAQTRAQQRMVHAHAQGSGPDHRPAGRG